jgi:DNA-binding response OmpR family regulator
MTSRVLVADDSLTIQKVIGITLANSGYELVECLNEAELLKKIHSNHFDLILLDFNLSDSHSGYDLAKQINKAMPGAAIIVMLGTFDTVDDSQFEACGISDKIVKPFESTKFIKKCRDLIEGKGEAPVSIKSANPENIFNKVDDIDMWKVDAPQIHTKDEDEGPSAVEEIVNAQTAALDPLSSEISGWGFAPSQSLEDKYQKSFPPVIEEPSEDMKIIDRLQSSSQFIQDEDQKVDLKEDQQEGLQKKLLNEKKEELELKPKVDLDATNPSMEIPEDLNRDLLSTIDEDISPEAFWAVDEIVPVKSEEEKYIEDTNLDEVTADLTESIQNFKEGQKRTMHQFEFEDDLELQSYETPSLAPAPAASAIPASIDMDELVEKLKVSLRPMIEELIKEYCRQSAEKVAWEVIPDLAENLIRKEIKEITESIH